MMHFLLTNDDGVQSPLLQCLARTFASAGHRVTVCAPDTQRSAASHSITMENPLFVRSVDAEGYACWSVSGTPADCTRLGLGNLAQGPVDAVISGINDGLNMGTDVLYSGTVGAAMEGLLQGLPGIAVSTQRNALPETVAFAAREALRFAEGLRTTPFPPDTMLNINVPARPVAALLPGVFTHLARLSYCNDYLEGVSPRGARHFWMAGGLHAEQPRDGSDVHRLQEGHVTYTWLTWNMGRVDSPRV